MPRHPSRVMCPGHVMEIGLCVILEAMTCWEFHRFGVDVFLPRHLMSTNMTRDQQQRLQLPSLEADTEPGRLPQQSQDEEVSSVSKFSSRVGHRQGDSFVMLFNCK
ncbi:hypothetical protein Dsin_026633 [Dipteronia sinensis]|uniref:Uncharacterized protein n=1 Tax=Dipteronia sinensis TaxID=43782 RepID=A0AAD9ZZF9_9ROSI|nr:hypothetical protein Dsin_026633 [Dipteronia sinensis]